MSRDTGIDAAEANRIFYRTVAAAYDETEHAVMSPRARDLLRGILERALAVVGPDPTALDACGGSGNVSELLVAMGVRPVLVDVSPEMLDRWREKAARLHYEPETVEGEIAEFLRADPRLWDLIVFSSALHHLDDYREVVALAAERLCPGGVLVTAFDPVRGGRVDLALRKVDWIAAAATHEPRDLLATISARLRRSTTGEPPIGRLAERYAISGIDDGALRRLLEERRFEVLEHERVPEARLALVRALRRLLDRPESFHLIARKPA